MKTYVGIDVSKDTLAVALPLTSNTWKVSNFTNSPDGIRRLKRALSQETHVIVEATAVADRRILLSIAGRLTLPGEHRYLSH